MKKKHITTIIHIVTILFCTLILSGCGVMAIDKGEFDLFTPPVVHKNSQKYNPEHTKLISTRATIGKNQTVKLHNVNNDSQSLGYYNPKLPKSKANISYHIINSMIDISISKSFYEENLFSNIGVGLAPYPYIYGKVGANYEHFEFGALIQGGVNINKATYSGYIIHEEKSGFDGTDEFEGNVELKDYFNPYASVGGGLYGGAYVNKFSIYYSGTLYKPWILFKDRIQTPYDHTEININFPYITVQDFGVSYKVSNKATLSLGATQLAAKQFSEQLWSGNIGLSWSY